MLQPRTIQHILRELQYHSVSQRVISRRWNCGRSIRHWLDLPYPQGFKNLVVTETVPTIRRPKVMWTISDTGVKFLQMLRENPDAMPPPAPRGRPRKYMGSASRTYATRRRRHQRNIRKVNAARQHPKHSASVYLQPLHIAPASPAFRRLSNLDKIRSLRTRAGRNRSHQ